MWKNIYLSRLTFWGLMSQNRMRLDMNKLQHQGSVIRKSKYL